MKKIYFLIFGLLLAGSAAAQLQTGSKFIGLHAGASLSKEDAFSKTISYEVAPSIGYFLTNKLMIGLQGGYGSSVTEQHRQVPSGGGFNSYTNMASHVKTTAFSAGITARYYLPVVEKFAFFVESSEGYARAKVEAEYQTEHYSYTPDPNGQPNGSHWGAPDGYAQSSSTQSRKQSFLYGNIAPGMVFFPTSRVGVELKANMINYIYTPDSGSQVQAAFNLNNTNMGVGFYF